MSLKVIQLIPITLLSVILVAFTSFERAPQSTQTWTTCFDRHTNKLYFNLLGSRKGSGPKCGGKTVYTAPKSYKLIETDKSKSGFSRPTAGISKIESLPNGRKLFVSQWNDLSQTNTILVLEPDFLRKRVIKHCAIQNSGDAFSIRFDKKRGLLKVLTNTYKNPSIKSSYHQVWENCRI